MGTPQTDHLSVKQMFVDTNDSPLHDIADLPDGREFPDAPLDGVHPNMWGIHRSINRTLYRVNSIANRLDAIDDQLDDYGT